MRFNDEVRFVLDQTRLVGLV